MSVDVVVAVPAFMDMTFVGLEGLPALGEERFAGDLVRSPGGGAITAIGAARLGLSTALAAPLGEDAAGDLIGPMLEEEGVQLVGARCPRTPITAVMPVGPERAMVTYDPGIRARASDVASLAPRAVITGLSQLDVVPGGRARLRQRRRRRRARVRRPPPGRRVARDRAVHRAARGARADRRRVGGGGGGDDRRAREDRRRLARRGRRGGLHRRPRRSTSSGYDVGHSIDTTGAGDLFVAAWAWGEAMGMDVDDALKWAALYAALSVRVPTGAGGATRLAEFVEEGSRRGLPAPPARGERVA